MEFRERIAFPEETLSEALQAATPEGWANPFFGWTLNIDWSGLIDEVNTKILSDGYSLFSIFFMMMLFKGILLSLAGPAPNYDMQKILATRSPREAALMSGFVSIALNPIRYLMIAGFAVLAIVFYQELDLMTGGNPIDAGQAAKLGLVDHVVDGDLRDAAFAWCRELTVRSPITLNTFAMQALVTQ